MQAALPRIRLADPDSTTRVFQVGSLAMTRGAVQSAGSPTCAICAARSTCPTDSLWFRGLVGRASEHAAARRRHVHAHVGRSRRELPRGAARARRSRASPIRACRRAAGARSISWRQCGTRARATTARSNIDLTVEAARQADSSAIAMGQRAGEMRLHDTQLAFKSIDTRTIEQLVPTVKVPRRGTASPGARRSRARRRRCRSTRTSRSPSRDRGRAACSWSASRDRGATASWRRICASRSRRCKWDSRACSIRRCRSAACSRERSPSTAHSRGA